MDIIKVTGVRGYHYFIEVNGVPQNAEMAQALIDQLVAAQRPQVEILPPTITADGEIDGLAEQVHAAMQNPQMAHMT